VLDASKFHRRRELLCWQRSLGILRTHGENVQAALPVGAVLTLPATGSESNGNAVLSRQATKEKLHFTSNHTFPVFSILDPEVTFTLPQKQVRNGIVDAFVHVMEQYMTYPADGPLQDRLAESVLQTLVEVGPLTPGRAQDYEARGLVHVERHARFKQPHLLWHAPGLGNSHDRPRTDRLLRAGPRRDPGHRPFGVWKHKFEQKKPKTRTVWKTRLEGEVC